MQSCEHCGVAFPSGEKACTSCGAPVSAARLLALRRARLRAVAIVVLVVCSGSGVAAWRATRIPPPPPVNVSHEAYVPKMALTVDYDEAGLDYAGKPARKVGVVVENRGEASVECLRLALRVLDSAGREQRNDRRDLRCNSLGDPLWPGERGVVGFQVSELDASEHFDVVVEEVTLGPPAAGALSLRAMNVAVSPSLGVADVSAYLTHELRAERLEEDAQAHRGSQLVVFTVSALAPLEVTDLDYELRVLGPNGEVAEGHGFASVAGLAKGYARLPALKPGRPVAVSINTYLDKLPAGSHWELRITRFATRAQ